MSTRRMIGFAFLVGGIIAFIIGMSASESVADQVSETFTGRFTDSTLWYIYGGIASAVVGLVMISIRGK